MLNEWLGRQLPYHWGSRRLGVFQVEDGGQNGFIDGDLV